MKFQGRIPGRYAYNSQDIIEAIQEVLGNQVRIGIDSRGFIHIDKEITPQEKQDIKTAMLPLLQTPEDMTK